jgi:RHS repeat-associated protein
MRKIIRVFGFLVIAILLLIEVTSAAEKVFFYYTDPAGTPLAMTDTSGKVVWRADYKPFGEEQSVTQNPENVMKFVGKEKDKETGLYYFGARYMKAEIGRFTSPDPVGPVDPRTSKANEKMFLNPQRLNLYAYGLNNPMKWFDPSGLFTEIIVWQPVGWGRSSFGHVSVDINGTTYSYEPTGMRIMPTSDYLDKNKFREGVGMALKLSSEQEVHLNYHLKNYDKEYGRLTNNCVDPIESGLENLGYDVGPILFPVSLGHKIMDLNLVEKYDFFKAEQPKDGTSAPWATK